MRFQIVGATGKLKVLNGLVLEHATEVESLRDLASYDERNVDLVSSRSYLVYPSHLKEVCEANGIDTDCCFLLSNAVARDNDHVISLPKKCCRELTNA